MPTIITSLRPYAHSSATHRIHNPGVPVGIDKVSWPVAPAINDPHPAPVGHLTDWDEGWADDEGTILNQRSEIMFDLGPALDGFKEITGSAFPTGKKKIRATLGFRYRSAGMQFMVGDVLHTVERGGSQLNRLYFSSRIGTDELFEPTHPDPIKVIAPFDASKQKIPASIQTSGVDYLKKLPIRELSSGIPPIRIPLAFITNVGGHQLTVNNGPDFDGTYLIDLTDKIQFQRRFGIVLAGAPQNEGLRDPDKDMFVYGRAIYFAFHLNLRIDV